MRAAERERAAFRLATTYASTLPSRMAPRREGCGASRRPMSARSTGSRRMDGCRASSARSRRNWDGEFDEELSLGLDFRQRRRMILANKPRTAGGNIGGAIIDLEALRDQNQRLKVALSGAIEENRRYQVNKTRLEAELLRADGRVETLLAELEQAPGRRDQRLLNTARLEVEKCAVVRTLVKQKGHLQKTIARQERELEAIKQTQEWSHVAEITAATEEYFLEIRRLQRLLAQCHQQNAGRSPVGVSDTEDGAARLEYVPEEMDPTRRSIWDVDDDVLIHRSESRSHLASSSSPVRTRQEARRHQKAESVITSGGGGEANRNRHDRVGASTAHGSDDFFTAAGLRKERDLLREVGMPVAHRRPASRERRASPPRRAQMAARAGRTTFTIGSGGHEQTPQTAARGGLGRQRRGGSRSQASIGAAVAKKRALGLDARRAAAGPSGRRPQSAPRRKSEVQRKAMGDARRADSMSSFEKGRRQAPSSGRGPAAGRGGRGKSDTCSGKQPTTRLYSSLHGTHIPTVPVPEDRPRSASPRSCSSRKKGDIGGVFRIPDGTAPTGAKAVEGNHAVGEECHDDGWDDDVVGASVPVEASSERVGDNFKAPPVHSDGSSGDGNMKHGASSASGMLLAVPATPSSPAAPPSPAVAPVAPGGVANDSVPLEERYKHDATAMVEDREEANEQAVNSTHYGSGGADSAIIKGGERKAAEGDEGVVQAVQTFPANDGADADMQQTPHMENVTGGRSMAESIDGSRGTEEHTSSAEEIGEMPPETSRNNSNGSIQSNGGNDTASPRSGSGDGSTSIPSESSQRVAAEEELQNERGVEGEKEEEEEQQQEEERLLFDTESDGSDVDNAEALKGENEAAPSEYGDDFDDDFEDEED